MFEVDGRVNKEIFKKLEKYYINPLSKGVFFAATILGIFYMFFSLYIKRWSFFALFTFLVVIIIIKYFLTLKRTTSLLLSRLEERHQKRDVSYKVIFGEDSLKVKVSENEEGTKLKYDVFVRLRENEEVFCIFTKANQFVVIQKQGLEEEKINELRSFIYEKCVNLK